jgi:putative transposase
VEFIDTHKDRFGVESICQVLREQDCGIAPSTYYAIKTRPPSRRAQRDEVVLGEIRRIHEFLGLPSRTPRYRASKASGDRECCS